MNTSSSSVVAPKPHEPRRFAVGLITFSAAISVPMTYCYFVLPAVLRETGHPAEIVATIALVYLPYALRVLWAPLVDRFGAESPLRFRRLALMCLVANVLALMAFMPFDPARNITGVFAVATTMSFLSGTGQTALDGYVLRVWGEEGRRRAPGQQATGFAAGGVIVGVGVLIIDGQGWTAMVTLLIVVSVACMLLFLFLPRIPEARVTINAARVSAGLGRFMRSRPALQLMAMSLMINGGMGLIGGYMPIFQVDSGLTSGQAGIFGAVGSNLCGLIAAMIAGVLVVRFGGWILLTGVGVVTALVFAGISLSHPAVSGPVFAVLITFAAMSLGFIYLIGHRALSLSVSGGPRAASQTAFLSSFDFSVVIIFGSMSGLIAATIGVSGLFALASGTTLIGGLAAFAIGGRRLSEPVSKIHQT